MSETTEIDKLSPIENNSWIRHTSSHTAIIFLHGILSNSDSCWRNTKAKTYWPRLIADDPAFEGSAIFVSGYASGMKAGLYDIYAAAGDVLAQLRTANPSPLNKRRLLFICHSQGGIVLRRLLCSEPDVFKDKKVGIILCGSPSWGSKYATTLSPLALFLRHRQARALSWGGQAIIDLDREFLGLLKKQKIPQLSGTCLVESKLFWPLPAIVSSASASRYFNSWHLIPGSTHSSLVKPKSKKDESHVQALDFCQCEGFLTRRELSTHLAALLNAMKELKAAYQPDQSLKSPHKTIATLAVLEAAKQTIACEDKEDRFTTTTLRELVNAKLDAEDKWPFFEISQDAFNKLHLDLELIANDLTKSPQDLTQKGVEIS